MHPVYVDEAIFPFRKGNWCHMWCADVETLHHFASSIGLKRAWFQDRDGFQHYDLSPTRRVMAINAGAVEITCREMVKKVREFRNLTRSEAHQATTEGVAAFNTNDA